MVNLSSVRDRLRPRKGFALACLMFAASASSTVPAQASLWLWCGETGELRGGSGTWDTVELRWLRAASAPQHDAIELQTPPLLQAWHNGNEDAAVFGPLPGTIIVAAPVNVNRISFQSVSETAGGNAALQHDLAGLFTSLLGYRFVGSHPIFLTGTRPTILVAPGLTSPIIGVSLFGDHGLTISGGGTLILEGENHYTGGTTVEAGTLVVRHNSLPAGGALVIGSQGTVVLEESDALAVAEPNPTLIWLMLGAFAVVLHCRFFRNHSHTTAREAR